MKKLIEFVKNPSGWDSLSNYAGETDFGDFYGLITQNRDSDCLTRSNFESAMILLGGESNNVEIHRFGHWACGWWEIIAIKGDTEEYKIGEEILEGLENYPILDEQHFSDKEYQEASEYWGSTSISDRIELCNRFHVSIFAARRAEMPETPSGQLCTYSD